MTPECVIGLVADTHGLVRPELRTVLAHVDLILHAGDVGGRHVLEALGSIASVHAVSGNVDDRHDPMLPRERMIPAGGLFIHVSHGDELGRPTPEGLFARYAGDVLVYGHTHRALMKRDDAGRLAVNPGAAGPRRFHLEPSVAKLIIRNGHADVEFIKLG
jgi:putative phosphoesterase